MDHHMILAAKDLREKAQQLNDMADFLEAWGQSACSTWNENGNHQPHHTECTLINKLMQQPKTLIGMEDIAQHQLGRRA